MATMPMSSAPLTRRTTSTLVSSRPTTKTRIGHPASWPPTPKLISGMPGRMMPASASPMIVRKNPIPTAIAVFSCGGMASNTARRKPVSTSTVISRPSSTIRPMISGQESWVAAKTATIALMPRPAASANGYRPTTPMRIVITPAISAVTAATEVNGRVFPLMSAPDRMIGLSTTM